MINNTLVHVGGRMNFSPSQIILLESDSNYTRLLLVDGSIILTATNLGKLETRFSSFNFFRPNRSMLINMAFMKNFDSLTNSIRMKNNETIRLSRRRVKQFITFSNQTL